MSELAYALHGLLIAAVVFIWFHLGWRRYAIDRGRDDILALCFRWQDLVGSNPEWRHNAACRALTRVLQELSDSLPRCSLGLAVTLWLAQSRRRSCKIGEVIIANLPDSQLRARARSILDDALLAIGATVLRQSIVAMLFGLLVVPLTLISVLAVTITRHGLAGLALLPASFSDAMRCLVARTLACATMIGMEMWTRESREGAARPALTVVER